MSQPVHFATASLRRGSFLDVHEELPKSLVRYTCKNLQMQVSAMKVTRFPEEAPVVTEGELAEIERHAVAVKLQALFDARVWLSVGVGIALLGVVLLSASASASRSILFFLGSFYSEGMSAQ